MNPLRFWLAGFGLVSTALAVAPGQTWDEVVAELGKPINRLEAPGRSIGRWAELEVTFEDGRVKSVVSRDLAAEAASTERRKKEAEAARKLREEVEAENRRREEDLQAREELERPERERKAQEAKIAALEVQLDAARAELRQITEQAEVRRARDRAARAGTVRKEISLLRGDLKEARAKGETERAERLSTVLQAKAGELQALQSAQP